MNGSQAIVRTLLDKSIDVCFANPGTSEMHFVAALDANPEMRCVLGLFEGVVTGAADRYCRMAEKPACQRFAADIRYRRPGPARIALGSHDTECR